MATVQAITLKFQTPSARDEGNDQQWSCKFHLTGAPITNLSDAETAAQGLAATIRGVISPTSYFSGWLHYPANSTINDFQAEYTSSEYPGSLVGYISSSEDLYQQAEVCMLWRAPTVVNSKGRMTYLFKYIHGIQAYGTTQLQAQARNPLQSTIFDTYNTGIDPDDRVPCAPDGTTVSDGWSCDEWLHTRQLRRGQAPKA